MGSFYSYLVGLGGDKGCCFLLLELKPRDVDKLLPNRLNEFCAVSDGVSFLLSEAIFESYSDVGVTSLRKKLLHTFLETFLEIFFLCFLPGAWCFWKILKKLSQLQGWNGCQNNKKLSWKSNLLVKCTNNIRLRLRNLNWKTSKKRSLISCLDFSILLMYISRSFDTHLWTYESSG